MVPNHGYSVIQSSYVVTNIMVNVVFWKEDDHIYLQEQKKKERKITATQHHEVDFNDISDPSFKVHSWTKKLVQPQEDKQQSLAAELGTNTTLNQEKRRKKDPQKIYKQTQAIPSGDCGLNPAEESLISADSQLLHTPNLEQKSSTKHSITTIAQH